MLIVMKGLKQYNGPLNLDLSQFDVTRPHQLKIMLPSEPSEAEREEVRRILSQPQYLLKDGKLYKID